MRTQEVTVVHREPLVKLSWGGEGSSSMTVEEAVYLRNRLEDVLEELGRGMLGAYKEANRMLRQENNYLLDENERLTVKPGVFEVFEVGDLVEVVEPGPPANCLILRQRGRIRSIEPVSFDRRLVEFDSNGEVRQFFATRFRKVID